MLTHFSKITLKKMILRLQNEKENKRLRASLEGEQNERSEMTIKFHEMKAVVDSYDSTLFDTMEIEFGKAKEMLASLELENSKLEEQ